MEFIKYEYKDSSFKLKTQLKTIYYHLFSLVLFKVFVYFI